MSSSFEILRRLRFLRNFGLVELCRRLYCLRSINFPRNKLTHEPKLVYDCQLASYLYVFFMTKHAESLPNIPSVCGMSPSNQVSCDCCDFSERLFISCHISGSNSTVGPFIQYLTRKYSPTRRSPARMRSTPRSFPVVD